MLLDFLTKTKFVAIWENQRTQAVNNLRIKKIKETHRQNFTNMQGTKKHQLILT